MRKFKLAIVAVALISFFATAQAQFQYQYIFQRQGELTYGDPGDTISITIEAGDIPLVENVGFQIMESLNNHGDAARIIEVIPTENNGKFWLYYVGQGTPGNPNVWRVVGYNPDKFGPGPLAKIRVVIREGQSRTRDVIQLRFFQITLSRCDYRIKSPEFTVPVYVGLRKWDARIRPVLDLFSIPVHAITPPIPVPPEWVVYHNGVGSEGTTWFRADNLQSGEGYAAFLRYEATFEVLGWPVSQIPMYMPVGYGLIPSTFRPEKIRVEPDGAASFFKFLPGEFRYIQTDSIRPGEALIAEIRQFCRIDIGDPSTTAKATMAANNGKLSQEEFVRRYGTLEQWLAKNGIDLNSQPAQETSAPPEKFILEQNYPNPFNPSTTISYALPQASNVTLAIYNTNGQLVRTLVDREMAAGTHTALFNGRDANGTPLASGVYLYKITAGEFVETKRMQFVK